MQLNVPEEPRASFSFTLGRTIIPMMTDPKSTNAGGTGTGVGWIFETKNAANASLGSEESASV